MSKYIRPTWIESPSQGDWLYKPRVKLVEAQDIIALEALIHAFFDSVVLSSDTTYFIEDIEFILGKGNNYVALVHYVVRIVN